MEGLIEELYDQKILRTMALTDRMFLGFGGGMIEVVHGHEIYAFGGVKPLEISARRERAI